MDVECRRRHPAFAGLQGGPAQLIREDAEVRAAEVRAEGVESSRCTDLSDWYSKMRWAPREVMLDALTEVDAALADRHREQGSGKREILRAVKAQLAAGR